MQLKEGEQALLDEAAEYAMSCEQALRTHAEREAELKSAMIAAASRLRGAVEAIVTAHGEDLAQCSASWNVERQRFEILAKEEASMLPSGTISPA